jgi:hypothetical protein
MHLDELMLLNFLQWQIVANLDFRSERILLPKIVSNITKFDETDEVVIKAKKGKINLEKF